MGLGELITGMIEGEIFSREEILSPHPQILYTIKSDTNNKLYYAVLDVPTPQELMFNIKEPFDGVNWDSLYFDYHYAPRPLPSLGDQVKVKIRRGPFSTNLKRSIVSFEQDKNGLIVPERKEFSWKKITSYEILGKRVFTGKVIEAEKKHIGGTNEPITLYRIECDVDHFAFSEIDNWELLKYEDGTDWEGWKDHKEKIRIYRGARLGHYDSPTDDELVEYKVGRVYFIKMTDEGDLESDHFGLSGNNNQKIWGEIQDIRIRPPKPVDPTEERTVAGLEVPPDLFKDYK